MYNTKIVCTYHTDEVFVESDDLTDFEREFIRNAIYRQEILDILGMDDYNEPEMVKSLHLLYESIKTNTELKECMLQFANKCRNADEEFGLMIMFAYDYMHLTHKCICELLESGKISATNMQKLKDEIV